MNRERTATCLANDNRLVRNEKGVTAFVTPFHRFIDICHVSALVAYWRATWGVAPTDFGKSPANIGRGTVSEDCEPDEAVSPSYPACSPGRGE